MIRIFTVLAATALAASCADNPTAARSSSLQRAALVLPWGSGATQVGFRPAVVERQAEGVSSVAVGPAGEVFLLDRLNGRVLRARPGAPRAAAGAPEDAVDLAVGPEGRLALYSELRARVWLRSKDGQPSGEVDVPRVFRLVRRIDLGPSRIVGFSNALQDSYRLGTPAFPQTLASILHSKREGAFTLPDGRGAKVHLAGGRPVLTLQGQSARQRITLDAKGVHAARIVGVAAGLVCLRYERTSAGAGPLSVSREVACVSTSGGKRVFSRALPKVGLYLPRRELAVGGAPARLAHIRPEKAGLKLTLWTLPSAEEGGPR